jgi:ribosome maturation factor RimP
MHKNELEDTLVPEVEAMGFECVKCEVVGASRSPHIRLYIDKPGGVSVNDCSRVSRAVGLLLDEKEPFPGRYLLEVSSPGSNRPLTSVEHFVRFAGSDAKVHARGEGDGKMTYTGTIRSCINDVLTLDTNDGEITIGLDRIISAQLAHQEYKIDKKMKKDKRPRRAQREKKRRGGSV